MSIEPNSMCHKDRINIDHGILVSCQGLHIDDITMTIIVAAVADCCMDGLDV